jgi:hypothetical protein
MVREFNNLPYFNSFILKLKLEVPGSTVSVLSAKKHIAAYTYADEILIYPNGIYDRTNSDYLETNKEFFFNEYLKEIDTVKKILPLYTFVNPPEQFNYFAYHVGDGWYKAIMSNTAKLLLEQKENLKWCVPTEERYNYYKNKRPYVVINGRWMFKNNATELYNNKYEKLIEFLISRGIRVINTTVNKPNLGYDPSLYEEPDCTDYLEQIAIFNNANMVYSIFAAGGINQHLLTKSNFCLVADGMTSWVHNGAEFGFCGISVVDARKMIHGISTDTVLLNQRSSYDRILSMVNHQPPQIDNFFDHSKVKQLCV